MAQLMISVLIWPGIPAAATMWLVMGFTRNRWVITGNPLRRDLRR